ncbi:MAG: TIGR02996 domain-containing protein [Gemmataceae bacterium]
MDDRQVFLAQIDADPLNHLLRCVFADWLDDRGESDEADRQRQWVAAFEYLRENFMDCYVEFGAEEESREPTSFADTMKEIEYWQTSLIEDGDICFADTESPEKLYDEADRNEFYRNLEIVTGTTITAVTRERASFRCAC